MDPHIWKIVGKLDQLIPQLNFTIFSKDNGLWWPYTITLHIEWLDNQPNEYINCFRKLGRQNGGGKVFLCKINFFLYYIYYQHKTYLYFLIFKPKKRNATDYWSFNNNKIINILSICHPNNFFYIFITIFI